MKLQQCSRSVLYLRWFLRHELDRVHDIHHTNSLFIVIMACCSCSIGLLGSEFILASHRVCCVWNRWQKARKYWRREVMIKAR